jgi:hypothetical protein
MYRNIQKQALVLSLLAFASESLQADSFRCGRKLVSTGDTSGELVRACGEPRHKDRGYKKIRVDSTSKKVSVERWYYKKSARSLEHIIVLYQGRIAAVDVGGR